MSTTFVLFYVFYHYCPLILPRFAVKKMKTSFDDVEVQKVVKKK